MTVNDAARPTKSMDTDALKNLAQRHQPGYRSVGSMAYDFIREAILDGTLAPGQRLRQETLAETIGISRLPIRSALIQLEADGLVEFHARRGAVVKKLSPTTAKEVYYIRVLLETEALRLSMADITPERIERIREYGKLADQGNEGSEFVDARTLFYSELYNAEARPVLWDLIEQLRLKLGRYVLGWRVVTGGGHAHSHGDLVGAVASGDQDRAVAVLQEHLVGVRDAVLALLDDEDQQVEPKKASTK